MKRTTLIWLYVVGACLFVFSFGVDTVAVRGEYTIGGHIARLLVTVLVPYVAVPWLIGLIAGAIWKKWAVVKTVIAIVFLVGGVLSAGVSTIGILADRTAAAVADRS